MVLGALAATFVVVNLVPTVDIYGARLNLQAAILDPLFPGALALGLVVLTWWLLKRVNPLLLLVVYLVISILCAYPFFGPDHTCSTDPAAQYQVCTSALLHPYYALRRAAGADGSAHRRAFRRALRLADAGTVAGTQDRKRPRREGERRGRKGISEAIVYG